MAGSPVVVRAETAQQGLRSPTKKKGKPDPTPASAEKRTASRLYQLKSGHALTGVYLKSTENRPDDHCWWCDPENISGTQQTRDHLFKHCSRWKDQQAEVGEGQRGNQEGEAEVACRRSPGGREVQPGGARLPVEYLRWTSGSPGGGELG